jgi:hypothetical protein
MPDSEVWRREFCRHYARVSGETAEIRGPLGQMEDYYRMDFSRCGGPVATRARIERITAWLRGRASRHPQGLGARMHTMIRTGLEALLAHVNNHESVCCTREELRVRSETKRMIGELMRAVDQSEQPSERKDKTP